MVAKVFSPNGVDIGRRLVSAGWALAYRRYSMDYVAAENEARKAKRGMWRGTFVKPWKWRASSPPRRPQAPVLGTTGIEKPALGSGLIRLHYAATPISTRKREGCFRQPR